MFKIFRSWYLHRAHTLAGSDRVLPLAWGCFFTFYYFSAILARTMQLSSWSLDNMFCFLGAQFLISLPLDCSQMFILPAELVNHSVKSHEVPLGFHVIFRY